MDSTYYLYQESRQIAVYSVKCDWSDRNPLNAEHCLDEAQYCHGGAECCLDVTSERRRQNKAGSRST
jgi:hypothetical protein